MPLTTLDQKTALIAIDLQNGIVALAAAQPVAGIIEHASTLADAFRRHGLPVVLVNVAGGAQGRTDRPRQGGEFPPGWTDIVPELGPKAGDHLITKRTWGAFTDTGLEELLKKLGVTQVVLAGVATSIGVESTARFAHEHGFHVTFAVDAMTDLLAEAHAHSLTHIFPRLGETGRTDEIVALLDTTRA